MSWISTNSRKSGRRSRPRLEPLEGRRLLSASDLDPSFGPGGFVRASFSADAAETALDTGSAVTVLGDGSLLVAGNDSLALAVAKLQRDGSIDTSFGTNGRVKVDVAGDDRFAAMAIQPDGKILLVATTTVLVSSGKKPGTSVYDYRFVTLRLNPNGSLDTGFGPGGTGLIIQDMKPGGDGAYALAVQPDGKILVGGGSPGGGATGSDSSLVRYNPDGSLDSSFGSGGVAFTAFSTGHDSIRDLAPLPDGRFLARGMAQDAAGLNAMFVARYLPDGTLDATFGSGGRADLFRSSEGNWGSGTNMLVDPSSGSITVVGTYKSGTSNDVALARLTADGALDPTFGVGGQATVGTPASETIYAVARQADGRIVAVGLSVAADGTKDALVARFNVDGTPDASFHGDGFATRSFSNYYNFDEFYDVAIQPDGRIVAVGEATVTSTNKVLDHDFLVARFQGDPSPLMAASAAPLPMRQALTGAQARPVLARAIAYWRSRGADVSGLRRIDLAIADLGGARLGEASGTTITLDNNAAGWGWDVGRGRRASGRISLLAALRHEVGHLLGHEHADEGVMVETLDPRDIIARAS